MPKKPPRPGWSVPEEWKSDAFNVALARLAGFGDWQLTGIAYAEEKASLGGKVVHYDLTFRFASTRDCDEDLRHLVPESLREGLCDCDVQVRVRAKTHAP